MNVVVNLMTETQAKISVTNQMVETVSGVPLVIYQLNVKLPNGGSFVFLLPEVFATGISDKLKSVTGKVVVPSAKN